MSNDESNDEKRSPAKKISKLLSILEVFWYVMAICLLTGFFHSVLGNRFSKVFFVLYGGFTLGIVPFMIARDLEVSRLKQSSSHALTNALDYLILIMQCLLVISVIFAEFRFGIDFLQGRANP